MPHSLRVVSERKIPPPCAGCQQRRSVRLPCGWFCPAVTSSSAARLRPRGLQPVSAGRSASPFHRAAPLSLSYGDLASATNLTKAPQRR